MSATDHDMLVARLSALEERVESLEGERPGRKKLPIVVSQEGVCGVDPGTDSASCPFASLYRRQKGCKGTACVVKSREYHANRKSR